MRFFGALAGLLGLVSELVLAQGVDRRVRILGASTFDVPGMIHVDDRLVAGPGIVSSDAAFVRAGLGDSGVVVTIPRAGYQFVAMAVRVDADSLTVRLENSSREDVIPLAAIMRLEVMKKRTPPHHRVLWTVLSGVGTFYGTMFIAFSQCFLGPCSNLWDYFIFGSTAGVTAATAGALRNERWEPISPVDLAARLAGS